MAFPGVPGLMDFFLPPAPLYGGGFFQGVFSFS